MNLFEQQENEFATRHIGPNEAEKQAMLKITGANSIDELIRKTIPEGIRLQQPLNTSGPVSESEYLKQLKHIALKNKVFKSYIG